MSKLREEEECSSDDDSASISSSDGDDEFPRRDELELSFVDLTPQLETLFTSIWVLSLVTKLNLYI